MSQAWAGAAVLSLYRYITLSPLPDRHQLFDRFCALEACSSACPTAVLRAWADLKGGSVGETEASSQRATFRVFAASRRQLVQLHRAGFQDRQPIGIFGNPAENEGIFLRIEFRHEAVARLNGCETRRNRKASLGIEGQYHVGVVPPRHGIVNGAGRATEEIIPGRTDECTTSE